MPWPYSRASASHASRSSCHGSWLTCASDWRPVMPAEFVYQIHAHVAGVEVPCWVHWNLKTRRLVCVYSVCGPLGHGADLVVRYQGNETQAGNCGLTGALRAAGYHRIELIPDPSVIP